jgi:hypothetical protein
MKTNKREIEVLVERIKYLESIIQDNITDINPEDLKTWSEEEVISTIENKDNLIQHLKERIKDLKEEELTEDESLHKWFKRQGPKGKEGGWIDCNAPDGKGGYKACGRKKGEERSKYPACKETPAQCKSPGKGKTWGKKQ